MCIYRSSLNTSTTCYSVFVIALTPDVKISSLTFHYAYDSSFSILGRCEELLSKYYICYKIKTIAAICFVVINKKVIYFFLNFYLFSNSQEKQSFWTQWQPVLTEITCPLSLRTSNLILDFHCYFHILEPCGIFIISSSSAEKLIRNFSVVPPRCRRFIY